MFDPVKIRQDRKSICKRFFNEQVSASLANDEAWVKRLGLKGQATDFAWNNPGEHLRRHECPPIVYES